MIDMTQYAKAKSDQLNAIDLGPTKQLLRIVRVQEMGSEQPIAIHYEGGDGRPYKPCKSMIRVLIYIWGENGAEYVGRTLEVYNDPDVTWGGEKVGGIRISRASHIDQPFDIPLRSQGKKRILHHVDPLPSERPRKTLAEHVDSYVSAVEGAETLEALAAIQQSDLAKKVRATAEKAENNDLLERMNAAGAKRYGELSPQVDSDHGASDRQDDEDGDQFDDDLDTGLSDD